MITHLGIAVLTFLVTNIDDLLILSIYFASGKYKTGSIVLGQYVGIGALIAVSFIGLVAGSFIADQWVSLLGLLPLFLGVKGLFALRKKEEKEEVEPEPSAKWQFLNVALVTIANGGDNIGVYAPLFATLKTHEVAIYIAAWLLLVGCWCVAGYLLVRHPRVSAFFSRQGKWILPVFLILLGTWILKDFIIWAAHSGMI